MLAACMSFSLQFYAALAAGHSFANHKMALSVAFFFVFQFVVQMAGAIVLVLLDEGPRHCFLRRWISSSPAWRRSTSRWWLCSC